MILFAFPGTEKLTHSIAHHTGGTVGSLSLHTFPDGESLARLETDVAGQDVTFLCSFTQPNTQAIQLMFCADVAKELGARRVGLIAPYLAYMRQDKRFETGQAITSRSFAHFLCAHLDWLITIDPHLHRYKTLNEIYSIPNRVLHATDLIAQWIKANVNSPILIGPDKESKQWVSDVAHKIDAPYTVLSKIRHGDRSVEVSAPDVADYKHYTPVLVDDIISTARTMIATVEQIHAAGMQAPICIGVHAVFANGSYDALRSAGAAQVVTCNTIEHVSNGIDVSGLIAGSIGKI